MKQPITVARVGVALMCALAVTVGHADQDPPIRDPDNALVFDTNAKQRIRVVTVATGLVHPWSIAFLPDGRTMLVAERAGRLRIIREGVLEPDPVWVAEPVPDNQGERGPPPLGCGESSVCAKRLRLCLVPKVGERGNTVALARGRLTGKALTDVREIFVAEAWETSGNLAGRMLFGPDGTLYLTVGDRDRLCCVGTEDNSLRLKAQDLNSHVGKTLRLRDDGSVPPDNPFVGRTDAKPEILPTDTGRVRSGVPSRDRRALASRDRTPLAGRDQYSSTGPELGWPLVSLGRNYTGTLVSEEALVCDPSLENPRIFWVPSISPSSIMFYTGDRFPAWKGSLFVGALNGKQLQRISFDQPVQAERREPLLTPLNVRIRDVQQGPDGLVYVATETRSAGVDPDGTILRLEPAR